MPRPLKFPTKLLIGFDDQQLAALDEWRRKQRDLPTRSEAIRRIVDKALAAPPRKTKKPSKAASS
jgi:hypothetical protein